MSYVATARLRNRFETLAEMRDECATFCERFTGMRKGVRLSDPEYQEIVEGRDKGPKYSSCGDLGHALLEMIIVTQIPLQKPEYIRAAYPWLNRASIGNYRDRYNVNRLYRKPIGENPIARLPRTGEIFETGDIAIVHANPDTSDSHVFVIDTHATDYISSWDYGQGAMSAAAWVAEPDQIEGCYKRRTLMGVRNVKQGTTVVKSPLLNVAGRPKAIQSVISMADVWEYLKK